MFDGEDGAAGAESAVTETTETPQGDAAATRAQRVVVERVDGIPAVPAVPEGIRRAADVDGITPAVTDTNAEPAVAVEARAATDAGELSRMRELVIAANQDVVPELIAGNSLDELLASVEGAKAAYAAAYGRAEEHIRAAVEAEAAGIAPKIPVVPAGGGTQVTDVSALAPKTKIARALEQYEKKRG